MFAELRRLRRDFSQGRDARARLSADLDTERTLKEAAKREMRLTEKLFIRARQQAERRLQVLTKVTPLVPLCREALAEANLRDAAANDNARLLAELREDMEDSLLLLHSILEAALYGDGNGNEDSGTNVERLAEVVRLVQSLRANTRAALSNLGPTPEVPFEGAAIEPPLLFDNCAFLAAGRAETALNLAVRCSTCGHPRCDHAECGCKHFTADESEWGLVNALQTQRDNPPTWAHPLQPVVAWPTPADGS